MFPGCKPGTVPTILPPAVVVALVFTVAGRSRRETVMPPGEFICSGAMYCGSNAGGKAKTRLHNPVKEAGTSKTKSVERVGEI